MTIEIAKYVQQLIGYGATDKKVELELKRTYPKFHFKRINKVLLDANRMIQIHSQPDFNLQTT